MWSPDMLQQKPCGHKVRVYWAGVLERAVRDSKMSYRVIALHRRCAACSLASLRLLGDGMASGWVIGHLYTLCSCRSGCVTHSGSECQCHIKTRVPQRG